MSMWMWYCCEKINQNMHLPFLIEQDECTSIITKDGYILQLPLFLIDTFILSFTLCLFCCSGFMKQMGRRRDIDWVYCIGQDKNDDQSRLAIRFLRWGL